MLSIRPASGSFLRATSTLSRPLVAQRASSAVFGTFRRGAATQSTTPEEALEILSAQRKNRPLSPDLAIYKFPIGGNLSAAHRISGVVLAFSAYGFFAGYAVLNTLGYSFDSSSIVSAFGALPLVAKYPLKFVAALPFAYHACNGLRHLFWDFTTKNLTKTGVTTSSKVVLGVSSVLSVILTLL